MPDDGTYEPPQPVKLAYMVLERNQTLHDLLAQQDLDLTAHELLGSQVGYRRGGAPASGCRDEGARRRRWSGGAGVGV